MISSRSAHDFSEVRENLEALARLCLYLEQETASMQIPEAARHAKAAADRIRERLAGLGIH